MIAPLLNRYSTILCELNRVAILRGVSPIKLMAFTLALPFSTNSLMIESFGLKKKVFLLGQIKNPKNIYLNSDLFIHASHFEGFPNSIVEAINFNLPTICSDCKGGTREIILNGKGGDLFPVGNYKILAKKIISFFKNPKPLNKKLILAKNNIKKYSLKNNIQKYDKLFLNL